LQHGERDQYRGERYQEDNRGMRAFWDKPHRAYPSTKEIDARLCTAQHCRILHTSSIEAISGCARQNMDPTTVPGAGTAIGKRLMRGLVFMPNPFLI